MQDHTNQLPIPVQVVQKNRLCFEIIAFSAASHCGLPTDSQSANNGKSKLNSPNFATFLFDHPCTKVEVFVGKEVPEARAEGGG